MYKKLVLLMELPYTASPLIMQAWGVVDIFGSALFLERRHCTLSGPKDRTSLIPNSSYLI